MKCLCGLYELATPATVLEVEQETKLGWTGLHGASDCFAIHPEDLAEVRQHAPDEASFDHWMRTS